VMVCCGVCVQFAQNKKTIYCKIKGKLVKELKVSLQKVTII
jgi:hypothetical protein